MLVRDHPSIELACDRARGGDAASLPVAKRLERAIATHFPSASVRAPSASSPRIRLETWCRPGYDPQELDVVLAEYAVRGALRLEVALDAELDSGAREDETQRALVQVLTRAQPYLDRRNAASADAVFERALGAHFALHDLDKPLVRADYAHALDTWQWTLRLASEASLPLQLAALFHDVERLVSEASVRVEQHAQDYAAFKRAHARRGGELVRAALRDVGLARTVLDRVATLVATHEEAGEDREAALLNDADALSFFSRNSAGFADYYGEAHTRAKVRYTLARMSRSALSTLGTVRLRGDIAAMLAEARAEVGA